MKNNSNRARVNATQQEIEEILQEQNLKLRQQEEQIKALQRDRQAQDRRWTRV